MRDPRIRNLHLGFASLLIDFDPLQLSHEQLSAKVCALADAQRAGGERPSRVITIPVCYDAEFGPDLAQVAALANITVEEVIRLHSSATYFVYLLGFGPGFGYMVGLPPQLHVPRLATPRSHVAAGSVAIAGNQTAIYPNESPGGWRLIGRTPLRMFNPNAEPPTRFQPGDSVKFVPIDRAGFDAAAARNRQR
jgi:inhibitor of KinA